MIGPFTPAEIQAILLSLRVAVLAVVIMLPFAIAMAYVLDRYRFWGRGLLDAIIHVPLVLPPVVTGYLLLVLLGRNGIIGRYLEPLGLSVAFTSTGAALAAGVMAFPLMVRAIRLGFEAIDRNSERAASLLGAHPRMVFWRITLPMCLPAILAGVVLGFAKALGEFGATITFVSNIPGQTQTIASAIYAMLQVPGSDAGVFRLICVSFGISLLAIWASEVLARRFRRDQNWDGN